MTLLQNEVESIHRAKNAANAIRDDASYAEVESAIEDLIKVIGRVQARLIQSNRRIKLLEKVGDEIVINYVNSLSAFELWRKAKETNP
jgi:hypothetical protein